MSDIEVFVHGHKYEERQKVKENYNQKEWNHSPADFIDYPCDGSENEEHLKVHKGPEHNNENQKRMESLENVGFLVYKKHVFENENNIGKHDNDIDEIRLVLYVSIILNNS